MCLDYVCMVTRMGWPNDSRDLICMFLNSYAVGYLPSLSKVQAEKFHLPPSSTMASHGWLACVSLNPSPQKNRKGFARIDALPEGCAVSSLRASRDGSFVVVGLCGSSHQASHSHEHVWVHVRSVPEISRVYKLPQSNSSASTHSPASGIGDGVADLLLTSDETNLVVVEQNGSVACYTDPAVNLKIVDQMLRIGWS